MTLRPDERMEKYPEELEALTHIWSYADISDPPTLYVATQAPEGFEQTALPTTSGGWVPQRLMTIALAKAAAKALHEIDTVRRAHQSEIDDLRSQVGRLEALLDADVQ